MIDVADLRKGNESAFVEAFRLFHEKLYFFFLKHTRERYLAEELVQVTFLKLWQYRENLSIEHSFSEQLFRIAKTSMIDIFRTQLAEKKTLRVITEEQEMAAAGNTGSRFDQAMDLAKAVETGVSNMPPVRQRVFKLSRYSGLSNKEIASQLSISPKTVERHITMALQQLRNEINN